MSARPRWTGRLHRVAIDLTPLRASRDYRLLLGGGFISQLGFQFTQVAVFVQATQLTRSTAAVGVIGVVGFVGLISGTVAGAAFIDKFDRRRTLRWAQVGYMMSAATLLGGAIAGDPPIGLVYGAVAFHAFIASIDLPTRHAMIPRMVGTELIPSALAMNQLMWRTIAIAGPALGGVVIASWGFGAAYAFDLVSYGALFVATLLMRPMPPQGDTDVRGWVAVRQGLDFVRRKRLIASTLIIDLIAMVFSMPQALYTFLAVSQFHRGTEVVGLLFAAPGVGAVLQALASGWTRRVDHQGRAVIVAVVAWGAAVSAFGLVGSNLPLALTFLVLAGAADGISAIFRSTITQVTTPERLRGRTSQIFALTVNGGPRLGDFRAGLVASWVGATTAVVAGGITCILGAVWVAWAYPELRAYRRPTRADDPGYDRSGSRDLGESDPA